MTCVVRRFSEGLVVVSSVVAVAAAGCRKPNPPDDNAPLAEVPPVAPPTAPSVPAAPRVLPARCPKGGRVLSLGDEGLQDDLEIGDAVAFGGGYAVGFARTRGAARQAAVALFGQDTAAPARIIELGPVLGDAPAPLLARRSGDLLGAIFPVSPGPARHDRRRALVAYALSADRPPRPWGALEQSDDSAVTDLASDGQDAVAVWDEVSATGRGVIRGAELADHQPLAPFVVSPAESDAEVPRIVFAGASYSVLWIARSPESAPAVDASEVPGETRSFGWLQMVELGAGGQVRGPVRDLTPRDGHVSAYDARGLGDESLLVVARDDGESVDGSGGGLLRVRVQGPTLEPALTLTVDSVGRGAPALIGGQPGWLSWSGHDEQLRLLPLDGRGMPSGLASAEDSMNDSRPLAVWVSAPGAAAQWLIASPTAAEGPLRVVECKPAAAP